jgi:predicted metalloprotease with PDZ domain
MPRLDTYSSVCCPLSQLGLDISLGVVEAVAQACEELHLSAAESVQEQVLACCRELHIDVGSQAHEQVPRGQRNVGERGMATQLNTLECVFSQSDLPLELDFSESLVVARVAAGGPADRAGVKTGMQLTHFQGEDLRKASFEEAIERMGATLEAHWRMTFAQQ